MNTWDNILTCGVYLVYVCTLLWMLMKEFLGYPVDWSQKPPFAPAQQQCKDARAQGQLVARPKIRRLFLDKDEDLEADITLPGSTGTGSGPPMDTSTKDIDEKMRKSGATSIAGDDEAYAKDVSQQDSPEDHVLPLYHTQPQPPAKPALEPVQAEETHTKARLRAQSCEQAIPAAVNVNVKLLPKALDAIVPRENQGLEEAPPHRLTFVKGLQYLEKHGFRFPPSPPKLPKHKYLSKKAPGIPTIDPSLANALAKYSPPTPGSATPTNVLFPPTINTTNTTDPPTTPLTPTTPTTPSPPLSPFPSSASCGSNYTATTEASYDDLPTPPDEDIPIHLISVPSWRCDPERAKFVFGSLSRAGNNTDPQDSDPAAGAIIAADGPGKSNDGEAPINANEFGAALEDTIIAMGLVPSLEMDSGTGADDEERDQEVLAIQDVSDIMTVWSRDSIMSDVVSWVESSSTI